MMRTRRFGTGSFAAEGPPLVKGWHVLAGMGVFFGLIIAVNVVFVTFAVRSFPGEDHPRAYTQGLDYNAVLEQRAARRELGWVSVAAFSATEAGPEVRVRVRDRDGRPVTGLELSGALRRPLDAGADLPLTFAPDPDRPGDYAAATGPTAPGQWELRAEAPLAEGQVFTVTGRMLWSPPPAP